MRLVLLIMVVFLVGCAGDDDNNDSKKEEGGSSGSSSAGSGSASEECNPVGDWNMTTTSGSGDCLPEGVEEGETTTIEQSDLDDIDKAKCQYQKSGPYHLDETDENYEIDGTLTITVTFEGDTLEGSGKLEADLLELGESVGSCEQTFSISGSR